MNPLDFSRIKDEAHPEDFLSEMKPFGDLMMYYRCAMMEVETKFKVLNEQFSTQYNRNPIETIKTRLKKPASIIEKIKRKNIGFSMREYVRYCRSACYLFFSGRYLYDGRFTAAAG